MKRNTTLATLLLLGALPLAAVAADTMGRGSSSSNPTSSSTSARDDQTQLFNQLDSNHDGYVSKEEARRSADVTSRFKELDADHDGKISSEEYRKGEQPKQ